ncbi:hypothetical protein KV102_06660 [Mumia sp. zg.B53]|uniref:DUF6049 family protein n=1 Tax=Mumia sp. zg.B53 TaxID=2855449 RepID=UPI001C6E0651|nr:DUF6049 family protein [Mumia sp. zg.B53]MBW9214524.1 hypothetical protein [Mumia sp. zg.B53]
MTRVDDCSSRPARRRTAWAAVATVLAALLVGLLPAVAAAPAHAADSDRLSVTIDALSPTALGPGGTLTLSGRITNPSSGSWSRLRVHLVMPPVPLTDQTAVDNALASPTPLVTGTRLTSPSAVVSAGDLAPGDTTTFRLQVPASELPLTTAGVFPVGVHVLATGEDAERSGDAVGRAYTVVPYVGEERTAPTQVSVVWPFVAPVQRDERSRYVDTSALVDAVSPGGRLRRLLDLARSEDSSPSTVLIDPALLDALRDIANDSYGPVRPNGPGGAAPYAAGDVPAEATSAAQRARLFLDELVAYAGRHSVWAVPYGRPDVFAITRRAAGDPGTTVVQAARRATEATLAQFGLTARIVTWPPSGITNGNRINGSRRLGSTASLVSPEVLSGWSPADSTALSATIGGEQMSLVVLDPTLAQDEGSTSSTLGLRQRVAARAALGSLGFGSRHVVVVPDVSFDPGSEWSRAQFHDLFEPRWVRPVGADAQVGADSQAWRGRVRLPPKANQRAISQDQVQAAARIVTNGRVVSQLLGDDERRNIFYDQSAALAASQDWRSARTRGLQHAESQAEAVERILERVSVSASSFVTLSGSSGRFPITITNQLGSPVTVGARFTSDDSAARIDDILPQEVGAGQSVTMTVTADVGQATTTTFGVSLVTTDGSTVGDEVRFTVRSSVVGRVIWVFLGLATLLVVLAVVRRVVTGRKVETLDDEPGDGTPETPSETATVPTRPAREPDA